MHLYVSAVTYVWHVSQNFNVHVELKEPFCNKWLFANDCLSNGSRERRWTRLPKVFREFRIHHVLLSYYFLVRAAYSKMPTTFTMTLDTSSKKPWCIALMMWAPWSDFWRTSSVWWEWCSDVSLATYSIFKLYIYSIIMCYIGDQSYDLGAAIAIELHEILLFGLLTSFIYNSGVILKTLKRPKPHFYVTEKSNKSKGGVWLVAFRLDWFKIYIHQLNNFPAKVIITWCLSVSLK